MLPGVLSALPGLFPALPGAPRLVVGTCRLVACAHTVLSGTLRCSQTYHNHSRGTPVRSSEITVTLKVVQSTLLGSDALLKLTHVGLHSTFSEILREAPSDWNTLCWCGQACGWLREWSETCCAGLQVTSRTAYIFFMNHCATLFTSCGNHIAVVLRVVQPCATPSITFIIVTITSRFATTWYGKYYLSNFINIPTYSQSGYWHYPSA